MGLKAQVWCLFCILAFSGCAVNHGASKDLQRRIDEFNAQFARLQRTLPEATDKIDPIALKEIYRDVKSYRELADRLQAKLAAYTLRVDYFSEYRVQVRCSAQAGDGAKNVAIHIGKKTGSAVFKEIGSGTCEDPAREYEVVVAVAQHGEGDYQIKLHYGASRGLLRNIDLAVYPAGHADRKVCVHSILNTSTGSYLCEIPIKLRGVTRP